MTTKVDPRTVIAQLAITVAETIRQLGEVPSGHLYARLMEHVSLSEYNTILAVLKHAGLVEEKAFLLRWVGPAIPAGTTQKH